MPVGAEERVDQPLSLKAGHPLLAAKRALGRRLSERLPLNLPALPVRLTLEIGDEDVGIRRRSCGGGWVNIRLSNKDGIRMRAVRFMSVSFLSGR